jgi:hypothetical protein
MVVCLLVMLAFKSTFDINISSATAYCQRQKSLRNVRRQFQQGDTEYLISTFIFRNDENAFLFYNT